jgi:hypothetical protein
MSEWMDIETAPRDGTAVLLFGCRQICVARYVEHDIEWWHVDDNKFGPWPLRGPAPTHWMPLPPPPGDQQ